MKYRKTMMTAYALVILLAPNRNILPEMNQCLRVQHPLVEECLPYGTKVPYPGFSIFNGNTAEFFRKTLGIESCIAFTVYDPKTKDAVLVHLLGGNEIMDFCMNIPDPKVAKAYEVLSFRRIGDKVCWRNKYTHEQYIAELSKLFANEVEITIVAGRDTSKETIDQVRTRLKENFRVKQMKEDLKQSPGTNATIFFEAMTGKVEVIETRAPTDEEIKAEILQILKSE
jgi:hypothetical protein